MVGFSLVNGLCELPDRGVPETGLFASSSVVADDRVGKSGRLRSAGWGCIAVRSTSKKEPERLAITQLPVMR